MGLDKLGILFIIIIVPIALLLNTYTNTQVDTLRLQNEYDTKLNNSTYDAVNTYKINTLSEDFSNIGDVRIGNINASINMFFTSLASNFNMTGYNRQFLQEYVPALVFTMYDGYYVYSKYTNTLDSNDYATEATKGSEYSYPSTYQNGQMLYGLKPFVHYSCRYKKGNNYNFVVSYTLDNYVTIQGIVDDKPVDKSGYLVDTTVGGKSGTDIVGNTVYYKGIEIEKEPILTDNIILDSDDIDNPPKTEAYPYRKVNGVKYYYDGNQWFTISNGVRNNTIYEFDPQEDDSAYEYYKNAIEFSKWVGSNLGSITTNDAVTENYSVDYENKTESYGLKKGDDKIFNLTNIEYPSSAFNQHRQDVIRYTIEKNLSIAIANYNTYNGHTGYEFSMPKFKEEEWDRIQSNMTIISYLQGLPIGTKIYNGVSVISNNVNEEVVSEQSIYIGNGGNTTNETDTGNNYYPVTYKDYNSINIKNLVGIYNVDLQRRQVEYGRKTYYYYPKLYYNTYSQERDTVNLYAETLNPSTGDYNYNGNLYQYLDNNLKGNDPTSPGYKMVKAFYTALGRERQSRYNQRNNYETLLNQLSDEEREKLFFNNQFKDFKGKQTGSKILELIEFAKKNNSQHSADEEKEMRVNVRNGVKPGLPDYYTDESKNLLSEMGAKLLDGDPFMYGGEWYNQSPHPDTYRSVSFVVPKSQDGNSNPDSYKGLRNSSRIDLNKNYDVNFFYYNGRIKGIYVNEIT